MEERSGVATENGLWDQVQTIGDLRHLVNSGLELAQTAPKKYRDPSFPLPSAEIPSPESVGKHAAQAEPVPLPALPAASYVYPHWPWWLPVCWLRIAFIEAVMRPLVWLLSKPKVVAAGPLNTAEPMLIVANHVTSYDAPLIEYALPAAIRRQIAVAMSGDMLEDYRHFRNADRRTIKAKFFLPGPLFYFLVTALFNVFPLPKRRDFQHSFAHAGEALDKGMHVLLFPEGIRSAEGELASFRPGIGLLVKQSSAPVLPMAIRGLGELKVRGHGWFRSGTVEVRIGAPMKFQAADTEAGITEKLHAEVEELLKY